MTLKVTSKRPGARVGQETLASAVYEQLRQDILTVALPAESKLNIRALCDRFAVGLSPVREALSRLSMENLVLQVDHRGFTVAPLSLADLQDLTKARGWIDGMGLRQSIEIGDAAWEEGLLVSYHRLSRTPRFASEDNRTRSAAWETAHKQFHQQLVAGCGSRWLTTISGQLFEAAERYRHLGRLAGKSRMKEDEHRGIMDAALAHKADLAVQLLALHFNKTAELVMAVMGQSAHASTGRREPAAGRRSRAQG
ncbi:GntR family transcriptional regulator [Methylocapsa sp. S129]|uniref:GntR family transcriptional regulator n=1 Tax=Methylocapsa sp. S129 TaxID=1641869 RepID=UPI00131D5F30|nr:GntR family transcriptional regulator [Methylocapsa sp. S129]